jgi:Tfp pilus assembly protein PilN
MRPVNLIPEDQRRGPGQNRRGGPLAFILVGALIALLAGVTLLVTTGNEISSEKAEAVELEAKNTAAKARVSQLAAYTQLNKVHDQRVATVTSLADSRFDWEQVMRELSLILPGNVWLTNLAGTVNPEVSVNGSAGVALRSSVPGPALEIVGCATSQDAVAGFVSSLKDIEGVTRVGVQDSELPGTEAGSSGGEPEAGSAGSGCQTKDFIAKFQIVAAFDAAPVPGAEAETASTGESEIAAASESSSEAASSTESASSSEGG